MQLWSVDVVRIVDDLGDADGDLTLCHLGGAGGDRTRLVSLVTDFGRGMGDLGDEGGDNALVQCIGLGYLDRIECGAGGSIGRLQAP